MRHVTIPTALGEFLSSFPYRVRSRLDHYRWKSADRPEDAYASHIPVLVGLCLLVRPRSVLELGPGLYSTALLLDKEVNPALTQLTSVENDRQWFTQIYERYASDPRFRLELAPNAVSEWVQTHDLGEYDLLLVDDSSVIEHRVETIRQVIGQQDSIQAMMVHDFENWHYRRAASCSLSKRIFRMYLPHTAVFWNANRALGTPLTKVHAVIEKNRNRVKAAHSATWAAIIRRELGMQTEIPT